MDKLVSLHRHNGAENGIEYDKDEDIVAAVCLESEKAPRT